MATKITCDMCGRAGGYNPHCDIVRADKSCYIYKDNYCVHTDLCNTCRKQIFEECKEQYKSLSRSIDESFKAIKTKSPAGRKFIEWYINKNKSLIDKHMEGFVSEHSFIDRDYGILED